MYNPKLVKQIANSWLVHYESWVCKFKGGLNVVVTINLLNIKNLNVNAVGVGYVACACFPFIDETVRCFCMATSQDSNVEIVGAVNIL